MEEAARGFGRSIGGFEAFGDTVSEDETGMGG